MATKLVKLCELQVAEHTTIVTGPFLDSRWPVNNIEGKLAQNLKSLK